jgi:hypothetical protein
MIHWAGLLHAPASRHVARPLEDLTMPFTMEVTF